MANLLQKLTTQALDKLQEFGNKYPTMTQIAIDELREKEFINDITYRTFEIIYSANNLERPNQIFLLLK